MKCDKCSKKAEYNVQENVYLECYEINPKEDYKKIYSEYLTTEEGANEFLCKEHYDARMDGE